MLIPNQPIELGDNPPDAKASVPSNTEPKSKEAPESAPPKEAEPQPLLVRIAVFSRPNGDRWEFDEGDLADVRGTIRIGDEEHDIDKHEDSELFEVELTDKLVVGAPVVAQLEDADLAGDDPIGKVIGEIEGESTWLQGGPIAIQIVPKTLAPQYSLASFRDTVRSHFLDLKVAAMTRALAEENLSSEMLDTKVLSFAWWNEDDFQYNKARQLLEIADARRHELPEQRQARKKREQIFRQMQRDPAPFIKQAQQDMDGGDLDEASAIVAMLAKAAPDNQEAVAIKERYDAVRALEDAKELIATGKEQRKQKQWLDAYKSFETAKYKLEWVKEDYLTDDHRKALSSANRGMKSVEKRALKERKKKLAKAAYRASCGDPPKRAGWDHGIFAVQSYVEDHAHDPDSVEVEGCTKPMLTGDACWATTCNVRGKNALGVKVLNRPTFWIAQGRVTRVTNL